MSLGRAGAENVAAWMDPKQTDGRAALDLAQETAVTAVVHYPVSSRVNNSKSPFVPM